MCAVKKSRWGRDYLQAFFRSNLHPSFSEEYLICLLHESLPSALISATEQPRGFGFLFPVSALSHRSDHLLSSVLSRRERRRVELKRRGLPLSNPLGVVVLVHSASGEQLSLQQNQLQADGTQGTSGLHSVQQPLCFSCIKTKKFANKHLFHYLKTGMLKGHAPGTTKQLVL